MITLSAHCRPTGHGVTPVAAALAASSAVHVFLLVRVGRTTTDRGGRGGRGRIPSEIRRRLSALPAFPGHAPERLEGLPDDAGRRPGSVEHVAAMNDEVDLAVEGWLEGGGVIGQEVMPAPPPGYARPAG